MLSKRLITTLLVIVLVFSNATIAFAGEMSSGSASNSSSVTNSDTTSSGDSGSGEDESTDATVEGTTDGAIEEDATTEEAIVTQQAVQNSIKVQATSGDYKVGYYSTSGYFDIGTDNKFTSAKDANDKMIEIYNNGYNNLYKGSNALVVMNKNNKVINMISGTAYFCSNNATVSFGSTYVTPNTQLYFRGVSGTNNEYTTIMVSGAQATVSTSSLILIPGSLVNVYGFYTKDYYTKSASGDLVHNAYSIRNPKTSGTPYVGNGNNGRTVNSSFVVDKAPSWMAVGRAYYSADGVNFYTDINLSSKAGTYYPYYKYLPYRSRSNYTYTNLNAWIKSKTKSNSKLRSQGRNLINAQNRYGVNAVSELAFACLESAYGTSTYALKRNNLFGINAVDSNPNKATYFSSVRVNINQHAERHLSRGYGDAKGDSRYFGLTPGNKGVGVNVKYASDPWHGEKISGIAYTIDKALGSKDYRKYTVGVTNKGSVPIYKGAGSTYLYNLSTKSKGGGPSGIPVVILGTSGSYYMIQSEMAINGNLASYGNTYYFDKSIAYVKKSDITIINNGNITYKNKHRENRDLRNITLTAGKKKPGKKNYFSGFNPHKKTYTVKVPRSTKKIKISGSRLMPVTSKVSGNGTKKFTAKKSKTYKIKVKSASGKSKTYKIKVVRK